MSDYYTNLEAQLSVRLPGVGDPAEAGVDAPAPRQAPRAAHPSWCGPRQNVALATRSARAYSLIINWFNIDKHSIVSEDEQKLKVCPRRLIQPEVSLTSQ